MDSENKSSIVFTVLSCTVEGEDTSKKESYTMYWDDLTVEKRPEERTTLSEHDSMLKEEYEKREQTMFLIQRSPLQTIRAGRFGGEMREYKLPYKTVLPVPLFMPSKSPTQEVPWPSEELPKMIYINGLCPEKREVTGLVSNLPKLIQPTKLRVSSFISPPPSLYGSARD
ncbi:telethonin-like [Discoglossus pictus]